MCYNVPKYSMKQEDLMMNYFMSYVKGSWIHTYGYGYDFLYTQISPGVHVICIWYTYENGYEMLCLYHVSCDME